jgi:hypothetical protein
MMHIPSQRHHLEQEYRELQRKHDSLTRAIEAADQEANASLDEQQREWCKEAAVTPGFKWPGLLTIKLPDGIAEKDRIQVVHK